MGCAPGKKEWFVRNAHGPQSIFFADIQEQSEYRRMQVHVIMRIDVIERESRYAKRLELGADLGGKLFPGAGHEEKTESGTDQVRGEIAIFIEQIFYEMWR